MTTFTRTGSCLLAASLAEDPFGAIHRAVLPTGTAFDKHLLARTFSDEFAQAGIAGRFAEITKALPALGGSRAYGQNYRLETGRPPHILCDFVLGRSLAQLIEKSKAEQIPFGVDHALSVVQGVAQAVVQMHAKGLHHGILSPHSVWVSFEGAIQLIDAPYASSLAALAPKSITAQTILAPYLQGGESPLQQDFFGVGAILFELLTFTKLPVGLDLVASALNRATLKAAQEEAPLPPEIKAFLGRLLLGQQPFPTLEAFNQELERVLYDGDFSPTTFSLAFFMHTLFREENDKDQHAMKAEQAESYLAFTAAGESLRSGETRAKHIDHLEEEQEKGRKQTHIIAGVAGAAVLVALLLWGGSKLGGGKEKELEAKLALLQRQIAEQQQAQADLEQQKRAEGDKERRLQEQLAQTKDVKAAEEIKKQLDEAKRRKDELDRQQKDLADRSKRLQEAQVAVSQGQEVQIPPPVAPTPKPQPAAQPQQVAQTQPQQPQPQQPQPQPQPQPLPQAPPQVLPQPQPSAEPTSETPARLANPAAPAYPARARAMRWQTNREHTVKVKVFVDESGRPLQVKILEGVPGGENFGFEDAAVDAANKSTYTPATRNGKAVKAWTEVLFKFPKQR